MNEEKMLKVEKIRRGTVIDHIPVGRAFKVLKILKISTDPGVTVSVAIHVKSKKMGLKDVVKIEDRILDSSELNKIALIAEGGTITIVDRSTILQVPNETYTLPIYLTEFLPYGKHVQKRLSGMLSSSITSVYHRNVCVFGCESCSTFRRMSEHNSIRITVDYSNRVRESFSLCDRACFQ